MWRYNKQNDGDRLRRETGSLPNLYAHKYPKKGFEEIVRESFIVGDGYLALVQLNDYAARKRRYFVVTGGDFEPSEVEYENRAQADEVYSNKKRELGGE